MKKNRKKSAVEIDEESQKRRHDGNYVNKLNMFIYKMVNGVLIKCDLISCNACKTENLKNP